MLYPKFCQQHPFPAIRHRTTYRALLQGVYLEPSMLHYWLKNPGHGLLRPRGWQLQQQPPLAWQRPRQLSTVESRHNSHCSTPQWARSGSETLNSRGRDKGRDTVAGTSHCAPRPPPQMTRQDCTQSHPMVTGIHAGAWMQPPRYLTGQQARDSSTKGLVSSGCDEKASWCASPQGPPQVHGRIAED